MHTNLVVLVVVLLIVLMIYRGRL